MGHFQGLCVAVLDDRRAARLGAIVERLGGQVLLAPAEREPHAFVRSVVDAAAQIVLYTSPQQVAHVLGAAERMGRQAAFRDGMNRVVIGSAGPDTSDALRGARLGVDFEPDTPRPVRLVRELARCAGALLERKRASLEAGIDVAGARRVDLVWPSPPVGAAGDPLRDSVFLRACRHEPVPHTPIWLMRQAGRYQRAYREVRARVSFLELCRTPELAAEVTLMAVDQLGVDAAIIFADILLIVEPLGLGLSFTPREGPAIDRPVRSGRDVDALREVRPAESLDFVLQAIRLARRALPPHLPLIGFAGAPFTVAAYMIEGCSSRDFRQALDFMRRDPGAWHALMERLADAHARYLNAQIDAGAQAVQLFDSWVGCLSEADYRRYVLAHTRKLILAIRPGVPVIHFGTNTAGLIAAMKEAGGDVIGVDHRTNLARTWESLGYDVAVQGNLDPAALLGPVGQMRRQVRAILDDVAGRPGHIFNLGHGVLPATPVRHAMALVDFVHEYSAAQRGRAQRP